MHGVNFFNEDYHQILLRVKSVRNSLKLKSYQIFTILLYENYDMIFYFTWNIKRMMTVIAFMQLNYRRYS